MPSNIKLFGFGRRLNSHRLTRTKFLEVHVISAQNLDTEFDYKKIYAVVSAYPDDKVHSTQVIWTHENEAWNDHVVVRVDEAFLQSDTSAITVKVYDVRKNILFSHDHLIGSTRIIVSTFLNRARQNVALQIRRPDTLEPCGILNVTINRLENPVSPPHDTPQNSCQNDAMDRRITSNKNASCSLRFDSKHLIGEDIEHALIERRRLVDKSGPLDEEQTEQRNLESKIEQWKGEVPPNDQPVEYNRRRLTTRTMSRHGLKYFFCRGGTSSDA